MYILATRSYGHVVIRSVMSLGAKSILVLHTNIDYWLVL
jgi:hypothetical protein